MAKSKYPLMCETARGIFGRQLVYRETKGIPVVSTFRPPTDRKTPAQLASREKFREIARAWALHSQVEKESLRPLVEGKNLTVYDYYTQQYILTGTDPLGPPPTPANLMATSITNLHLPTTIGPYDESFSFHYLSIPSTTYLSYITDRTNIYNFVASAPEQEIIVILITNPFAEITIPAGYIVTTSTDIISDLPIYFPEFTGPGQVVLFPAITGSTYYDPDLTMLAQAAP